MSKAKKRYLLLREKQTLSSVHRDLHVNSYIKIIDIDGKTFHFSSTNFVTFNLYGFNIRNDFLRDFCADNSIVCVQELW